jgi:hypothetical protein
LRLAERLDAVSFSHEKSDEDLTRRGSFEFFLEGARGSDVLKSVPRNAKRILGVVLELTEGDARGRFKCLVDLCGT